MRVLLATGIEQLDKALQERLGENVSVCYYREAVVEEALKQDAEVVVLSISLPGTAAVGIEDVVLELRMANRRVVLLPGARDGSKSLVRRAVALGVYDIVYDPLSVDAILERIERPAVLADVGKATGETPESALPEGVIPDYVEQENSVRKVPFSLDRLRGFARHLPDTVKKGAFSKKPLESGDEFQYEAPIYQDEEVSQLLAVDYVEPGTIEVLVEEGNGPEALTETFSKSAGDVIISSHLAGIGKVVAVGCPWGGIGSAGLSAALARKLPGKTAVVDIDLRTAGLAACFGLRSSEIEGHDWRRGGLPILSGGVVIFPLDPSREYSAEEGDLLRVLDGAGQAQWTVLEMGSDLEAWWFAKLAGRIDVMLWVIQYDQMEYIVARWKKRPGMGCREFAVLLGEGDTRAVEEALVVPCLQLQGVKDNKGLTRLIEALRVSPKHRGKRVMAVGFEKMPDVPDAMVDVFRNVEEAMVWLQTNRPDMALISADLVGGELLAYDLRALGIPVKNFPFVAGI